MRRLVVTPAARRDILDILRHSQRNFGADWRGRYRRLIELAFDELRRRPRPPAARPLGAAPEALMLHHLRHAAQGRPGGERVHSPRHVLVYRFDEQTIEIVRVLHDAMDVPARLTDDGSA